MKNPAISIIGDTKTAREIKSFDDLFAHVLDARYIFIPYNSPLFRKIKRQFNNFQESSSLWTVRPRELTGNMLTCWSIFNRRVRIILPGATKEKDIQWPLDLITDEKLLAEVIYWLRDLLDITPTIPIHTARKLLEATARPEWLRQTNNDFQPFLVNKQADLFFVRKPTDAEKKLKWLHCYDKKRMYLSAYCTDFGVGEYTHQTGGQFRADLPGLYRVRVRASGKSNLNIFGPTDKELWLYSPMLWAMELLGYSVEILEGLYWKEKRRVFEKFYKTIYRALVSVESDEERTAIVRETARGCLKSMYARFASWLAHEPPAGRANNLFRPDWRALIVAEARARIIANICKIENETGLIPVAVRADALMYLSDEPDAQKAMPAPLAGPGASFKHEYTVEASQAFKLIDGRASAQALDDKLKEIAQ